MYFWYVHGQRWAPCPLTLPPWSESPCSTYLNYILCNSVSFGHDKKTPIYFLTHHLVITWNCCFYNNFPVILSKCLYLPLFEIFGIVFIIQISTLKAATWIPLAVQILFIQNCINVLFFPHHHLSEIPTFPSIPCPVSLCYVPQNWSVLSCPISLIQTPFLSGP